MGSLIMLTVLCYLVVNHFPKSSQSHDSQTSKQFDYQIEHDYFHSLSDRNQIIPDHVWADRDRYADYQACIEQNGDKLGFK